jgi:hypothetical protein
LSIIGCRSPSGWEKPQFTPIRGRIVPLGESTGPEQSFSLPSLALSFWTFSCEGPDIDSFCDAPPHAAPEQNAGPSREGVQDERVVWLPSGTQVLLTFMIGVGTGTMRWTVGASRGNAGAR